MKLLTLEEMAEYLAVTPKTLNKYVEIYQIPFIGIGRNKRFNAQKVEKHLETVSPSAGSGLISSSAKRKIEINSNSERDFFRRELGLR